MLHMRSRYTILFIANILILLNSCSTRYIVSSLDTSYQKKSTKSHTGDVVISIPKDSRINNYNVPNFNRTWGYLTDRGLYNNILSSENIISASIADIIVSAFQSIGYNAKVAGSNALPMRGEKVVESEIRQFWVDSKCSGFGVFFVTTSINLHLKILDSTSHDILLNTEITVSDYQKVGALSMSSGVKSTSEIFSANIEKFKSLLLEKIEGNMEKL